MEISTGFCNYNAPLMIKNESVEQFRPKKPCLYIFELALHGAKPIKCKSKIKQVTEFTN